MNALVGTIVSVVVGSALAAVVSLVAVSGLSAEPEQSNAPLIVYGDDTDAEDS